MFVDNINTMAMAAKTKVSHLNRSGTSYLVSAILGGTYIGIGIVLIFSLGAPLAASGSAFVRLVMASAFGIALTLIVFAGGELFTGNNMIMTLGVACKKVPLSGLLKVWTFSWSGNLLGSLLLAFLVVASGALAHTESFIEKVAIAKMTMPPLQMFLRGILCNWLVCLALWSSARTSNDAAKCIVIFWCLFAFIACGYEHSVANMTLLGMALFSPHGLGVSWMGFGTNLLFVTFGNIVGGALFVGGMYWLTTHKEKPGPNV
jgi:nitrite transporter NirC